MGDYKKENGTTRIGDFLRSIGKSEILAKALAIAGNSGGGLLATIAKLLTQSQVLTPEQKELALKELEMDMQEMDAITRRWEADAQSDTWLAKNVRPMVLVALVLATFLFIAFDSGQANGFSIDEQWIVLLKNSLTTVFFAYFGSRGAEKIVSAYRR